MMADPVNPTVVPADAPRAGRRGRRAWVRAVVLAVVLAGALMAFYASPARVWLRDQNAVRRVLADLGVWAYPACILASAVMVPCGAPRLLLAAVGAMVLGFGWGLVLTQAGALLGYYGVFCFVRWGGREWVLHRWPKLRPLSEGLKDYGIGGVFLVRQVPVHGSLTNLALGLSGVRHYQFLIGSGIGMLPEAVPAALIGAGLVSGSFEKAFPYLAGAALAMGVLWVGVGVALRRIRRGRVGALLVGDAENGADHAGQSVLR
jgi:uncharacterized membrane protein YdjX (TVP38/TMEM64 family)